MTYLLDVNVVLAAHRDDHPHYSSVRPWFDALLGGEDQFTVPMTVWASFLRPRHRRLPPPTWDDSDVWGPLRHIAMEGRIYVVGVNFCLRGSDIPRDLPGADDWYGGEDDWLARGNTAIVGTDGDILAGPLVVTEGIVVDRDLRSAVTFGPASASDEDRIG